MLSRATALTGAAALALAGLTAAGGPARAAGPAALLQSSISWGPCQDATLIQAGAQCGTLDVPIDWTNPAAGVEHLALSKVAATHDRQGVMLANPGGPGASGLELPAYLPGAVPRDIGHTYDWIGFDPRGVGASTPAVSCDPNYLDGPRPAYKPTSESQESPNEKTWITRTKNYTKTCLAKNGALLAHMHTADTIRDMDAIRIALGEQKLNYYGFSYGTFLGQAYATLHPANVGRMVLDGNVPPDYPGYGDGGRAQMTAFQNVIGKFFGWIAAHDTVYHLGSTGTEVNAAYDAIEAKLTASPVGQIGPAEWDDVFLVAGYAESRWPGLAAAMADWGNGNHELIESLYAQTDSPGDDNSFAAFNATFCTDGPFPTDYRKVRSDAFSIARVAPVPSWGGFWFSAPCTWWPVKPAAPLQIDGRMLTVLGTPILLINATEDGATPFAGALAVRREFPTSALVAEVGATTHAGSLQGNGCVDNHIADYLENGTLPGRVHGDKADATCARKPLPEPSVFNRAVPAETAVALPPLADGAPLIGVDFVGVRRFELTWRTQS
ncbi:MAG TPA: alpha/beta hydrolase [Sporichthyaceae bacterium]|jgi:pimeloyl-ACP methyl ester carboxylesterase